MAFKNNILFDVLNNIISQKSLDIYKKHIEDEELFKTFSKYMCLRYLTMSYDSKTRDIVLRNYLSLERMPEKILYKWLIDNIPQKNNSFIRYIK